MSRCGCAGGTCSCVVQGSGAISVTGAGTVASPFVVSGGGVVTVQDTATVDLTLTGSGSVGSPYVLRADALVSLDELTDVNVAAATTGQVLGKQADGSWIGIPAPTAAPGAITVGTGLLGDGSAGNPLRVATPAASGHTTFTPVLTATTTNPTLGNGTSRGWYITQGDRVDFDIEIAIGSTTQRGAGYWMIDLPVAAYANAFGVVAAHLSVPNVGDFVGVSHIEAGKLQRIHFASGQNAIALQHGWPTSLPAGSLLTITGSYRKA